MPATNRGSHLGDYAVERCPDDEAFTIFYHDPIENFTGTCEFDCEDNEHTHLTLTFGQWAKEGFGLDSAICWEYE